MCNFHIFYIIEMQDFQKIATSFTEMLNKVSQEVEKEKMKVNLLD